MTKTEQVYGGSLYDLAREENATQQILDELHQAIALFNENPDYWRFLSTLSIAKSDRCQALDEAFRGHIHPYLLNFMKLLTENGTIGQLKGCALEFRRRYNEEHDIVEIVATTAVPMRPGLQKKLQEKLQAVLHKTVQLRCKVDPDYLGGVLLELPGRQLDGTVKHRLDTLSQSLRTVAL